MGFDDDAAQLRELASGIDALYLSGKGALPVALFERLEVTREAATDSGTPQSFQFGGYDWLLQPRALLKYRYRLDHELAVVGLTNSQHLPAVRVQARAEALHSIGAAGVVGWVRSLFDNEEVNLSATGEN